MINELTKVQLATAGVVFSKHQWHKVGLPDPSAPIRIGPHLIPCVAYYVEEADTNKRLSSIYLLAAHKLRCPVLLVTFLPSELNFDSPSSSPIMADTKPSGLGGIDANGTDSESAVERTGAEPAEVVPFTEKDGATLESKNESQLDQATLMATRPNGGWKAWLQVACGFALMFNTYGTTATISKATRL